MNIAAEALKEQATRVREVSGRLRQFLEAIDSPKDLSLSQALHWYAVVLQFRPDVIIELGRGEGNSTAVFTEAANAIGAQVRSFDLSAGWVNKRRIDALVTPSWYSCLNLLHGDIVKEDFARYVGKRTLVLWDAHGFEIADAVLGGIMPLIGDRPHLVVCHDISDNRFSSESSAYTGPIWRGVDDFYANHGVQPRSSVNIFWISTIVDQAIPIIDFCYRNRIELHSADWELAQTTVPTIDGFTTPVRWVYFTLNEAPGPLHYPSRAVNAHQGLMHPAARELAEIRSSLSWRITRPLRTIKTNVMRAVRRSRLRGSP